MCHFERSSVCPRFTVRVHVRDMVVLVVVLASPLAVHTDHTFLLLLLLLLL